MKLIDLNPCFYMSGGEGVYDKAGNQIPERHGLGLICDCPCGCGDKLAVAFKNPLDGGPPREERVTWDRTGDTFETITLRPSILRVGGCAWHGYLTNGEFKSC